MPDSLVNMYLDQLRMYVSMGRSVETLVSTIQCARCAGANDVQIFGAIDAGVALSSRLPCPSLMSRIMSIGA